MKTCKTCNGPLLYWNPERYNYRKVIALLSKAREAGLQQLPEGIYTLNEAVNCQQCAEKRKVNLPRCKVGQVEQRHIVELLTEPLTCAQLSERVGFTSRNGDRRLKTLVSQGVIKIVSHRPLRYLAV